MKILRASFGISYGERMFSAAIFRMTLRQLVGRHRWGTLLMVLVLAAMPAAVALLIPQRPQVGIELVKKLLVPWLVPALVLLGGATVLREEIQNQTFVYLYLKPISRLGLVLSQFAAALVVPLGATALSSILLALASDGPLGVFLGVGSIAVIAYGALFFMLSLFFSRVVLWAFGYLVIWEGFLSGISQSVAQVSVKRYALGLAEALQGSGGEPSALLSITVLFGLVISCLAISAMRLRALELAGSAE
jgi:hypothetical protein